MSGAILLEARGRRADLTIHRPPLNILDLETIEELDRALAGLAGEEGLQLLVLRGAGEKAFSAGVAVEDHTADKVEGMLATFHRAIRRLRELPAVTLAAVRGHCLGGGLELAAACDLVLAAEGARFGQPEILLGCYPPVAAALYPRLVGPGRTLELLLTGRTFGAAEAERIGLATWHAPEGELEERLEGIAGTLLARSGAVTRLTKRAVLAGRDLPFAEALAEAERIYLERLAKTRDMEEGIAAFLEKRDPEWSHR